MRREAQERAARAETTLAHAVAERDDARAQAARERARADQLDEELRSARAELSDVQRSAGEAVADARRDRDAYIALEATVAETTRRAQEMRQAIGGALDEVRSSVDAIDAGLEAIGRVAGHLPGPSVRPHGGGSEPGPSSAGRAGPAVVPVPGRVAELLPPATFDDSPEAAEHLVRVPGMLILVDGYNVTLSAWADQPIREQRQRLVDASAELAARSGAEVVIVFDGAESTADLPAATQRRRVRWMFSPADVEADDVLLGLVTDVDIARPVTVASNDRRVLEGARRLGANVISTGQLLGVLRRERTAGAP